MNWRRLIMWAPDPRSLPQGPRRRPRLPLDRHVAAERSKVQSRAAIRAGRQVAVDPAPTGGPNGQWQAAVEPAAEGVERHGAFRVLAQPGANAPTEGLCGKTRDSGTGGIYDDVARERLQIQRPLNASDVYVAREHPYLEPRGPRDLNLERRLDDIAVS